MKSVYKNSTSDLSKKHKATQEKGGPLITTPSASRAAPTPGLRGWLGLRPVTSARSVLLCPLSLWRSDSSGGEAPDTRLLYTVTQSPRVPLSDVLGHTGGPPSPPDGVTATDCRCTTTRLC